MLFRSGLVEDVTYSSRLNTFLAFRRTDQFPDVVWENYVSMEVNHWLSTDIEFVATYNENVSKALQLKEKLSVGVQMKLN